MANEVTTQAVVLETALIQGDLSKLSPEQRTNLYMSVCTSLKLNHLTKPFDYIVLNGKLTLYAKRDCTDQLRSIHGISIKITSRELTDDIYSVTALATDKNGRTDESVGAVCLGKSFGDSKANLLMKAETKAKRRVTLSICGLGLLDETEVTDLGDSTKTQSNTQFNTVPGGNTPSYMERQNKKLEQPATEPQRKKLYAMMRSLGYDNEQAKDWLMSNFNVESSTELSKSQIQEVFKMLDEESGKGDSDAKSFLESEARA